MADPAGLSGSDTHTGAHARPALRLDPLGEVKRDLEAVLALLEATRVRGMGRRRDNRFAHALEAARREVRRALEAAGAGSGS
jgi:hypothetical protein